MYGAQAVKRLFLLRCQFENDVEMYGAQALVSENLTIKSFENDVEMYGAQAETKFSSHPDLV